MSPVSSGRASWSDGLPYGWWKSGRVWGNVAAGLSVLAFLALLTVVVLAWWGLIG